MSNYPNYLEIQRQNELRKLNEAQNRLALLEQQAQMQTQQNQYINQNNFTQPQVQVLGLNGKFVQSQENITANDVPMDGSVAFFPRQDMSELYARAWLGDGTIKNIVYRPVEHVLDSQATNSTQEEEKLKITALSEVLEGISAKVDTLANRLDEFIGKPKTNTRSKKEADAE